jgi:hypothetical protein
MHVILASLDFIARLAARVSKPRVNLTRFHGRVFNIAIETCSQWGGAMKVIACIEDPIVS